MAEPAAGRPGILGRINFNTVLAAACLAFSAVLFVLIPHQIERPPILLGQSGSSLDPALFPSLVAAGFLLVGGWYLRASFGFGEPNAFRDLTRENYLRLAVTIAVFVLYASILQPLGFILASAIVAGALSIFYGARSILGVLLVAVGVPAAVYVIFRRALSVALPEFPDF